MRRVIKNLENAIILPYFIRKFPVRINKYQQTLPADRDFTFIPSKKSAYFYIIDFFFSFIQVRNNTFTPLKIPKGRIGILKEFTEQD
jgi:hypothetical protein